MDLEYLTHYVILPSILRKCDKRSLVDKTKEVRFPPLLGFLFGSGEGIRTPDTTGMNRML